MKSKWTPIRSSHDGAVNIRRLGPCAHDDLEITVTHDDVARSIVLTDWNARRIFGMLSVFLELPLSATVGKQIKMGNNGMTTTMVPDRPLKSFGERVAYSLTSDLVKKEMKKKYGDAISFPDAAKKGGSP